MKKFPIFDVYGQEAERLLQARKSVRLIHSTGDVDASGDELEIPVRDMLARRLPSKYLVGHGHVVDSKLNVSPQFDVIIADSNATPILYEGENGAQYFPYESVYAIGEIKSTYYKSGYYVRKFTESVKTLLNDFYREDVPGNYIGHGITLGRGLSSGISSDKQNEIFSFMLLGSKNDMNEEELNAQLSQTDYNHPNVICFLDGSTVTKAHVLETEKGHELGALALVQKFGESSDLRLVNINFTNENKSASALTTLMLALFQHLNRTRLKEPPFGAYVESIMTGSPHESRTIK